MNENNIFSFNLIKFDLRPYSKSEEIQRIINDHGMQQVWTGEEMFELKKEGYIFICVDSVTFFPIFYFNEKTLDWTTPMQVTNILADQKPIKKKKVKKPRTTLNLDSLLDKINESGMQSLTPRELKFLEESSK